MTSHDGEHAGIRRDADGFLWISHWRDASPNRVAGTRLEGSEPAQIRGPDRSAVGGVLPPAPGRPWYVAPTGHGTRRRSVTSLGCVRTTRRDAPGRLQSGSAMGAESWCRARRRPRFPPPGVLMRIKHSSWREALQSWVVPALRAARATGASWCRARRRLLSGSSAVSAATTMARCTASGARVPDPTRAGTRRVAATKPRLASVLSLRPTRE